MHHTLPFHPPPILISHPSPQIHGPRPSPNPPVTQTHIPNIRAPSLIYHLLSTVSRELPDGESEESGTSRVR
jgi:hypothetical protein